MNSSLQNNPKQRLKLRAVSYLMAAIVPCITFAETSDCYNTAYMNDSEWPQYVTPNEPIELANGTTLSASIPLVLSRAYEDGKLAVVDRVGTELIDHSKTNFVKQVKAAEDDRNQGVSFHNFIQQLGRRVFDLSHSTSKAVSEKTLSKYDSFLIIRCAYDPEAVVEITSKLDQTTAWLNSNNCRPIILFEESVPNAEFYQFLETNNVNYPVVVPIFTQGLRKFVYTERESDSSILWINANGKCLKKAASLETFTFE